MNKFYLIVSLTSLILLIVVGWFFYYLRTRPAVYSWDDIALCTLPAIGAKCLLKNGVWVPYGPQWDGSQGVIIR